jgi:formylglycine-generating enzyme required for sulfatase activity
VGHPTAREQLDFVGRPVLQPLHHRRGSVLDDDELIVGGFGAQDLAGNVSEWVEEYFAPYPGNPLTRYEERNKYRVLRGGSWDYSHSIANGYHRQYALPHSQMTSFGFRCVKAADEGGGSPPRPQTR